MGEHRLRMTDTQLIFLIDRLQDLEEGYLEMIPAYRRWRQQHKNDLATGAGSEYARATDAYYETNRKHQGTKDMIERLSAILQGGKPRVKSAVDMVMRWSHEDRLRLDAEVEAREAEEAKAQEAEKVNKPKPDATFKLEIDGEAKE